MQSDVFIIINIQDKKKTIPSLISKLGRRHIKSSILATIADYIYKEKHSIPITMLDADIDYGYRHNIGGPKRKLIKSFMVPRLEESLQGIDFIGMTSRGLDICLDGLLNKNTFLLQIGFRDDKDRL